MVTVERKETKNSVKYYYKKYYLEKLWDYCTKNFDIHLRLHIATQSHITNRKKSDQKIKSVRHNAEIRIPAKRYHLWAYNFENAK